MVQRGGTPVIPTPNSNSFHIKKVTGTVTFFMS